MVTLHYNGMRFGPGSESSQQNSTNKVQNFGSKFRNMGALVIRFQLGQAQRAALLQEIGLENYHLNPIGTPNEGNNQKELFAACEGASNTRKKTTLLTECAHGTLGVGKVLNERRQPQKHKNTEGLGGEALIWDIMHTTVWQVGINLAPQLAKQGFLYIASPANDDPLKHQAITEALSKGEFSIIDEKVHVCGEILQTAAPNALQISLKKNQFVISGKDKEAQIPEGSLGWIMHKEKEEIIDSGFAEDIFRIIKVAGGGFHRLNPEEQEFLLGGLVKETKETTVTQNAAFNGLFRIAEELNKKYGFDPEKLFGNGLNLVYTRITEHFKANPSNLDDFLTGTLLSEMVQSLKTTKNTSERKEAPKNFINPFSYTANNNKAFAYAFNVRDANQKPVLKLDSETPFKENPNHLDVEVQGELALPSLTHGKHASAILATSLLVGEQMLLEQLLRTADREDSIEKLLVDILGYESDEIHETAVQLKEQISKMKRNQNGAIMGLQYEECEPIVATLRKTLNFNHLIKLTEKLCQPGVKTQDVVKKNMVIAEDYGYIPDLELNPVIQRGLKNLYKLGNIIQNNKGTSAENEGSRGINAGLRPLISKLSPELARELPK